MYVVVTVLAVCGMLSMSVFAGLALANISDSKPLCRISKPVVVLTMLPIGWPFYIVSWLRNRAPRRPRPFPRYRRDCGGIIGFDEHADFDCIEEFEDSPSQNLDDYAPNDLDDAQAAYAALRSYDAVGALHRKKQNAQARFDYAAHELKGLSQRLKELQADRQKALVELKALDEQIEAKHKANESDTAQQFAAEFARIRDIKGVKAFHRIGDSLCIIVQARASYKGMTFDKGEWELRLSPGATTLYCQQLRSGRRSTWVRGSYPDYSFSDGGYCFGSNEYVIHENLQNGQYLQAIELAVACLNAVNEDDIHKIPLAFKRMKGAVI